jgi:two-component system, LytTR family, response regulator LytT
MNVPANNIVLALGEKETAAKIASVLHDIDPTAISNGPFNSTLDTLRHFQSGSNADLLICDIQLTDGKSFSILNAIPDIPVIFVAESSNYALDAFQYNSIAYLLKPVAPSDFKSAFTKFQKLQNTKMVIPKGLTTLYGMEKNYRERFVIKAGNKLLIKTAEEAAYFYAEGKAVYLVTKSGKRKYIIDNTLEELDHSLDSRKFFRISRKHIVCVDCIEEVKGLISGKLQIKLQQPGEQDLSVSRERAAEFKKWLDY